jgi:ketosteroid isomerase-like protein
MNASRALAAAALLAYLAACSPRRIPGTEILDNADTRAIVAVIEQYQAAAEKRDPAAVLALVSTRYFDDAGTPDPVDDLDYAGLSRALPEDLARLSGVRMEIKVTDIKVDGDKAQAFVRFDARYRVATRSGEVAKTQNDVNRLSFAREQGTWKITSGL